MNLNASSATSWSSSCGEIVDTLDELKVKWDVFQEKIASNMYLPRHLILNTVAPIPSTARLMQLWDYHRNVWCEQYMDEQAGRKLRNYFNMSLSGLCHYDCMEHKPIELNGVAR